MASGLGEVTAHAQQLASTGDLHGAHQLLSAALADTPLPSAEEADADLAQTGAVYAAVLAALGETGNARGWAEFAYTATSRLHGPQDSRTVSAAAALAAILGRGTELDRAAELYRYVITELTAGDGPESLRVLAAHADLARVEHAAGDCAAARSRLAEAWELHREVYGDGHRNGLRMLARLGAMQRDCGRPVEAGENLALARELCRQHLRPDDPLVAQIAALAEGAADPEHHCQDSPADSAASAASAGGGAAADRDLSGGTAVPGQGFAGGAADRAEPTGPARTTTTASGPEPAATPGVPPTPAQPPPTGRRVPPRPRSGPDAHRPRPFAAPAQRRFAAPIRRRVQLVTGGAPAGRPDRMAFILAGVVIVVLGVAAVISGFGDVDQAGGPAAPSAAAPEPDLTGEAPPTTAPQPTAAPPASPGSPPANVTLRDDGASLALTWSYPAGAESPVIISGGLRGQPLRAFEQLPAGTGEYVVHGLDPAADFCFRVAVAYSPTLVGAATPVCTDRE